jgi:hypothetical protein
MVAAIAGMVVFIYMRSQKKTDPVTDTSSSNSQTTVAKPQASAEDVDTTSGEIDAALDKADDTTDLPASEISDDTLGL